MLEEDEIKSVFYSMGWGQHKTLREIMDAYGPMEIAKAVAKKQEEVTLNEKVQ